MNEILLSNTQLPIVTSCDFLAAAESFYHADRITDFHVMIYVTDGCIHVTEGDTDYALSSGDLLFLKSGIRHFGKTEIQKGTRWHYVHFYLDTRSASAFHSDAQNPGKSNCRESIYASDDTAHLSEGCPTPLFLTLPKTLAGLTDSALASRISFFTDSFHSMDPGKLWNRNHLFFQLLTEIANHSLSKERPFSLADRIAHYLTEHYAQPFSAAALEHQFFLSYQHMAAVFKREKQQTMQQYHTHVRMNIACKLLRSTLLSVGEISQQVGYSDLLYFSRCFHSCMGMSPTEYRKLPQNY